MRVKLIGEYYVEGSETPTTFSMRTSQNDIISSIFSTDSNYSPIKFNDCFAPDSTGEYYYYVGSGYSVATKNNVTTINKGDSIKLFQGFLEQGVTPVSVVYFRDFDNVPYNVSKVSFSLKVEIATSLSWNMPDVELLTEDDVEVSLIGDTYEITAINTTATTYALPGYYNGTKITHIGSAGTPLDTDAVKVYFANTMTHIGGYGFYDPNAETAPDALSLSNIYLGNNVTTIYKNAFTNTSLSGNLILPITVEYIGDFAFAPLSGLNGLFPYTPNCAYYGQYCFSDDINLTGKVIISGSVGECSFVDTGIDSVKFLSTATTIGNNAFYITLINKIVIDSENIASLNSSDNKLYFDQPVNLDVFVKEGLTIGNNINDNLYESKSFVSGYRRFGNVQNILWYAVENPELILNSISWNYAGPNGYTVDNQGDFDRYTINTGNTALSKVALYGVNTYYLPIPIVSGYTFNGWYTEQSGGTKIANADGTWVDNADGYLENGVWIKQQEGSINLYPQFTAKEYNISYNWNAADSVPSGAPNNYTYGTTTTIPKPTRIGYTFIGWNISVQLNGKIYGNISNTGALEYNNANPNAVLYELFNINSNLSYTFNNNSINKYFKSTGKYYGENYTTDQSNWLVLNTYPQGRTEDYATYSFDVDANYVIDALQVGNLTLTARWQKNESFLLQNWLDVVVNAGYSANAINSITFTGTIPTETPLKTISVGASDKTGTSVYVEADFLDDVTAYVFTNTSNSSKYDIYLYSPTTIYAPVDSTALFSDANENPTNLLINLKSINFNGTDNVFNTKYMENMSFMFFYCQNLTDIELYGFDTSNVTNMRNCFALCNALTNINIECAINFDTSKVENMSHMFSNCSNLATLPNLDVSSVIDVSYLFNGCLSFQELNLSSWNLSNATITNAMFNNCSNLRIIQAPYAINADLPLPSSNWYNSVDFAGAYSSITSNLTGKTLRLGQNVTFNANGGSISSSNIVYWIDSTYGSLPTPTRTGYNFDGWFTDLLDGTQITADTIVSNAETRTLYAHWTLKSYNISDYTAVYRTSSPYAGELPGWLSSGTVYYGDVVEIYQPYQYYYNVRIGTTSGGSDLFSIDDQLQNTTTALTTITITAQIYLTFTRNYAFRTVSVDIASSWIGSGKSTTVSIADYVGDSSPENVKITGNIQYGTAGAGNSTYNIDELVGNSSYTITRSYATIKATLTVSLTVAEVTIEQSGGAAYVSRVKVTSISAYY